MRIESRCGQFFKMIHTEVHTTARYVRGTLTSNPVTVSASGVGPGMTRGAVTQAARRALAPGRIGGQPVSEVGPLLRAARDDEPALLKRVLTVGVTTADLNAADCSGRTAVSYVCGNGAICSLEALLQAPGLDVNLADNEGNTPLHYAAQAGHIECLSLLLQRGRSLQVDARNDLGFTALMKAALQGRTRCAKLLLLAGASPTLRDCGRGLRAEQWARFCGRYSCAETIEKFARQRLLDRSTSCGRWGGIDQEAGARLLAACRQPDQQTTQTHHNSLKSKFRKVFRTSSNTTTTQDTVTTNRLVTQLTSAALCASSPVLPTSSSTPVVKSLIRPLQVPKVQVTLVSNGDVFHNLNPVVTRTQVCPPTDYRMHPKPTAYTTKK